MMHETTTGDNSPQISLLDSSKASVSTSGRSNNSNELVEQLRRQLRALESENLSLKRAIPHLRDAKGDNCTDWAIDMANQLEDQKAKYRESQDKLAALSQQYRELMDRAEQNARQHERMMADFQQKAQALEDENQELKNRLRDEESANYHLQHDALHHINEPVSGGSRRSRSAEHFEECLRNIDHRSEGELHSRQSTARTDRPDSRQHQAALEGITVALFDKLRTTANFFMQLLTNIGQDAEQNADYELFERIKNMKLHLNHSIEMYNKKMEELRRSAASSIENSFHDERGGPSNQQFAACSRCKLLENERDALKAQLNREIGLKEEFLAQNEEQDKALREMRRQAEELRSELESGRAKVEEIEQKLQKTEEYYQTKYVGKQSTEQAELNEKVRVLRQRNIELDAKNEEILRAVQRFKELNQEELTNKDIEIQRLRGSLGETERRCKQLEADYRHLEQRFWKLDMERQQWGKATNPSLEEELKKRDALVRKYAKKMQKLRDILSSYGHYFDQSVDYEALVERSTEILESKLAEGQRTASSASMAPVNNHHHHHHNNRHPS